MSSNNPDPDRTDWKTTLRKEDEQKALRKQNNPRGELSRGLRPLREFLVSSGRSVLSRAAVSVTTKGKGKDVSLGTSSKPDPPSTSVTTDTPPSTDAIDGDVDMRPEDPEDEEEPEEGAAAGAASANVRHVTFANNGEAPAADSAAATTSLPHPPSTTGIPVTRFYSATPSDSSSDTPSIGPVEPVAAPTRPPNSMVSGGLGSIVPWTSTRRVTVAVNRQICEETRGKFSGPMDPIAFMDEFMPAPVGEKMPAHGKFTSVKKLERETLMYDPFIAVCRRLDRKGTMTYLNSSSTVDPQTATSGDPNRTGQKPDVMFYLSSRVPKSTATTDFARVELFAEFKYSETDDAFVDDPDPLSSRFPFEARTEIGKDTRGQIAAYASATFQLQFRRFFFSLLIMGDKARFIRWDRSGATVTSRFDYIMHPERMAEFIWRHSFLTDAQRGHDESIKILPDDKGPYGDYPMASHALLKRVSRQDRELFLLRMSSREPPPSPPTSTFSSVQPAEFLPSSDVEPDAHDAAGWDYYVLAPLHRDRSPFGKATRSLLVWDWRAKQVRHLKDTHRIPLDQYTVEHKIIQELWQKGVEHIATVHCAWDVAPHGECYDTVSPEHYGTFGRATLPVRPDDQRGRTPLRMYRLISNEFGTELWKFKSWKEVVQVIVDILKALDGAEEAGIRHRDLSTGNIMIWNGRGLLIDWDACQYVEKMNKGLGRQLEQTGTWQFISAKRLRDIMAPHEREDDIESVFWVLLFLAFKFSRHTLSPDDLKDSLQSTFDDIRQTSLGHKGGSEKESLLKSEREDPWPTKFQPHMLQQVLHVMHRAFKARYQIPQPPEEGGDPDVVQDERMAYEVLVRRYNREKAMWSSGLYLRESLQRLLDEGEWPADDVDDGPHENLIPADSEPATRKRPLDRESAMEAPAIAERRSPKRSKATKKLKGKKNSITARVHPYKKPRLDRDAGRGGASLSTVQERDE